MRTVPTSTDLPAVDLPVPHARWCEVGETERHIACTAYLGTVKLAERTVQVTLMQNHDTQPLVVLTNPGSAAAGTVCLSVPRAQELTALLAHAVSLAGWKGQSPAPTNVPC